jgi:hypothetical protein
MSQQIGVPMATRPANRPGRNTLAMSMLTSADIRCLRQKCRVDLPQKPGGYWVFVRSFHVQAAESRENLSVIQPNNGHVGNRDRRVSWAWSLPSSRLQFGRTLVRCLVAIGLAHEIVHAIR